MSTQLTRVLSRVRALVHQPEAHSYSKSVPNDPVDSSVAKDGALGDPSSGTTADPASPQPIDDQVLRAAARTIRSELALRVDPCMRSQADALDDVFVLLFGERRSEKERLRFLAYAAPIARRLVLEGADKEQRVLDDVTVADVRELFMWCDAFDPLGARIVDLHYVAGLSVRQTACALQIHQTAVVRDLRVLKSWLRIKLDKLE